jgi:hypothetical protein
MFFYASGSLLFGLAMMSAMSVMASDFAHYRHAMMKALRNLSLDGLATPSSTRRTPQVSLAASLVTTRPQPRAAA